MGSLMPRPARNRLVFAGADRVHLIIGVIGTRSGLKALSEAEVIMRMFFGMILGCLLTIAAVYIHDTMATSTAPNGMSAGTSNMIVNWNVAAREWGRIEETVHTAWSKLQAVNSRPSKKGEA